MSAQAKTEETVAEALQRVVDRYDRVEPFNSVYIAHMRGASLQERGFVLLNQIGRQISPSYGSIELRRDGTFVGRHSRYSRSGEYDGILTETEVIDVTGNVLRRHDHFVRH